MRLPAESCSGISTLSIYALLNCSWLSDRLAKGRTQQLIEESEYLPQSLWFLLAGLPV